MKLEILKTESFARRGRMTLAHGTVETPVFMPVGTYGAVKTVSPDEVEAAGSQIILGNTYHLNLRPGTEVLEKFGGLHRFMGWEKPILTDSGGFQVFSLSAFKKITEEGVAFRSPLNGDLLNLTPESCARIQQSIGSDIAMVLDECVALPSSRDKVASAVERSHRWAERFLAVPRHEGQDVFGIAQGGTDLALRQESLERTLSLPIDGLALGGLSVGEPFEQMVEVLEGVAPKLPEKLPRYLMGVGTPRDLLEGVRNGIDMFDCVLPTRNARNGGFFTDEGLLNIRNSQYRLDPSPIEEGCDCLACRKFSRGYLRHLFQMKEILGCRLATLHNLHYYHRLMFRVRKALESGTFGAFYKEMAPRLRQAYPPSAVVQQGEL
jgi:queuine tRNA-ribosyltransferase